MIGCNDIPTWDQNEVFHKKKNSSYNIGSSSELFFPFYILFYFFCLFDIFFFFILFPFLIPFFFF